MSAKCLEIERLGHAISWHPDRYLTYSDERGRPFADLLARVAAQDPRTVVDLGCGPGNLTALLARRWPAARVSGIDNSTEMVARARTGHPEVDFTVQDVRDYAAGSTGRADVLVSSATLQWLPGHLELLPELVRTVAPGGLVGLPGAGQLRPAQSHAAT